MPPSAAEPQDVEWCRSTRTSAPIPSSAWSGRGGWGFEAAGRAGCPPPAARVLPMSPVPFVTYVPGPYPASPSPSAQNPVAPSSGLPWTVIWTVYLDCGSLLPLFPFTARCEDCSQVSTKPSILSSRLLRSKRQQAAAVQSIRQFFVPAAVAVSADEVCGLGRARLSLQRSPFPLHPGNFPRSERGSGGSGMILVSFYLGPNYSPSAAAISSYLQLRIVFSHAVVTDSLNFLALHHFQSEPTGTKPW